MKRISIVLIVAFALALLPASAYQAPYGTDNRYVPVTSTPYASVNDFFTDKYGTPVTERVTEPTILIDPDSGQPYAYEPYSPYAYGRVTQNSYYQITDPSIVMEIKEGSYDDGYNYGYYLGYADGIEFQRFGYEGYYDYIEAMKSKYDPEKARVGYYQFNRKAVRISVTAGNSDYNKGYGEGIVAGFKDGYYNVDYQGVNRDYYAFKQFQKENPGTYTPIVYSQLKPRVPYRSYPYYQTYMTGRMLYGFNY
jgi:hypothetical protein